MHKDKRNLIQLLMSELKNLLKKVWKFSNNLKIKSIYIRNKVLILAFLSSYHSEESKPSNLYISTLKITTNWVFLSRISFS